MLRLEPRLDLEFDEGEQTLYVARRHWVVLVQRAIVPIVIMLMASGLVLFRIVGGRFIVSGVQTGGQLDIINIVLFLLIVALLVFWRQGCAPCSQLNPALDRLASAYAGKALIAKINVQDNPALVRRYGVTRLPELIVVQAKSEQGRAQGAAGEAALRAWLESLVGGGPRPAPPSGPSVPLDGTTADRGPRPGAQENGSSHAANRAAPQPSQVPGGAPVVLTDATFDQVVGASDTPVLVDFWAPWCGPCRMMAPHFEQAAKQLEPNVRFAKLNTDDNPQTAGRYDVLTLPTLILFRDGAEVARQAGALDSRRLTDWLRSYL